MTCSRNKLNTLHIFKRILVTKVDIFKSCLVQKSMETLFISRNVLLSCEPIRYYFHKHKKTWDMQEDFHRQLTYTQKKTKELIQRNVCYPYVCCKGTNKLIQNIQLQHLYFHIFKHQLYIVTGSKLCEESSFVHFSESLKPTNVRPDED